MPHSSKLARKVSLAEKLQASQPQYVICQTLEQLAAPSVCEYGIRQTKLMKDPKIKGRGKECSKMFTGPPINS